MKDIFTANLFFVVSLFLLAWLQFSCAKNESQAYFLIKGNKANEVELSTICDLKNDLAKVCAGEISIISESEKIPSHGIVFILGTTESNGVLSAMINEGQVKLSNQNPGPRGGIWTKKRLPNGRQAIVIGGSDVQGLQYAIYDYAHEILGVDSFEYWTGMVPAKNEYIDLYDFEDRKIEPPKVPILCYFENDVDELANYRGNLLEYDWESYTEMINSLVRNRYNAIHFFDMLGRPEFFIRPEYKTLDPDYEIDMDYVDKMIDYAHLKGMKVQIDFSLGYQINPFPVEKANCWTKYKEDWIAAWKYYLEETPLAKTDIFSLRPRHQVWDWEYESSCGEDKITIFNEVYEVFGDLIDQYSPEATKVLVCYADGMNMFNNGLNPPKDWIVAWSDNGFGDFEFLPKDTKGYEFGTYMHAGFWSNHTVHNPYPHKVETVMKTMFQDFGADKYSMINGQNFRPFLLNIEAYSEVCNSPENFNGELFYRDWVERYFGIEVGEYALASMKNLHKAQENRIGYVQHLWEIREAISYLSNAPIERPGKTPVPYDYKRVENDFEHVINTEIIIAMALSKAEKGLQLLKKEGSFYYSYIYLPSLLYSDLISFERTLHQMAILKKKYEDTNDTAFLNQCLALIGQSKKDLQRLYEHREAGDKNNKWANWYAPEIRRPNNGFPTVEMLQAIETNLNLQIKKSI